MEIKYYILELLLRAFTGIIFLFQGYDKLFRVRIKGVADAFFFEAQKDHVPRSAVMIMATYTSCVEFSGGILLIAGLFKTAALAFLGLDLVLVAIAFSMLEPMWDMRHVFPRLLLVAVLLAFPSGWELYSLDRFLGFDF